MDFTALSTVFGDRLIRDVLVETSRRRLVSSFELSDRLKVDRVRTKEALKKLEDLKLVVAFDMSSSEPGYRITRQGSEIAEQIQSRS